MLTPRGLMLIQHLEQPCDMDFTEHQKHVPDHPRLVTIFVGNPSGTPQYERINSPEEDVCIDLRVAGRVMTTSGHRVSHVLFRRATAMEFIECGRTAVGLAVQRELRLQQDFEHLFVARQAPTFIEVGNAPMWIEAGPEEADQTGDVPLIGMHQSWRSKAGPRRQRSVTQGDL